MRSVWITAPGFNANEQPSVAARWLGSGNQFAGMGAFIARRFPHILQRQQQENTLLRSQFCDAKWLNGKLIGGDRNAEVEQADYIMGQVTTGTIGWDVLETFGIQAHLVPSSLGESALMFSTRTWRERDAMWERCNSGTLFSADLGAPYRAVQQYLNTSDPIDWRIVTLPLAASKVQEAIDALKRTDVWLGIVNAPQETVAVGCAAGIHALQEHLGQAGIELVGITSVHAPSISTSGTGLL